MSDLRPAQELIALAEEELGLVASGRTDELAELQERRDAVLAQLPDRVVEPTDREALAKAHALQVQITALLEKATAEMASRLNRLDRGRGTVKAYASSLKQA